MSTNRYRKFLNYYQHIISKWEFVPQMSRKALGS
jgi:hypothetical protein